MFVSVFDYACRLSVINSVRHLCVSDMNRRRSLSMGGILPDGITVLFINRAPRTAVLLTILTLGR
ncbi:hypothetical protein SAMN04488067_1085 [Halorubrum xinjiangense]|uniref:Uncharacterized protein n=1 Tax=Halorubrum xinjiangense TaxID=261291 RepID=A0A1G7NK70_9EURY|nr:hypothetical protein SAMN04488067_1085 [Halorubrum xinjiangense]